MSNNKTSDAIRDAGDQAAKKSHEISEKLAHLSDEALNKVDQTIEAIQNHSQEYSEVIEDYVQKKPLKALGIAMLVGAGLATFLKILKK